MKSMRAAWARIVGTFGGARQDEELSAELESHLRLHVEDNLRAGMTPNEARRAALIALGGVEQTKQMYRERRGLPWIESLWQDVRFSLRILRKNPGFAVVAIMTLALGIGANAAIFTLVYGTLMRALPFPEPGRILQLGESYKGQTGQISVTARQLERLRNFAGPFDAIAGYTDLDFNVTSESGAAEHVRAMPMSADMLRVLAEEPEAGRNFSDDEDSGAGAQVALVSHALSVGRFGGATAGLGKVIFLSGTPYTVVGVMPSHFSTDLGALDGGAAWDVWIPLARVAKTVGGGENIGVLARAARQAQWAQVTAQTELARADFHKEFPGDAQDTDYMSFFPLAKLVGVDVQPYLLVLFGATGFVLLIACANVSNLLLARGSARTREVAVRIAMGASRGRLLRQLLTESMIIAVAGGALGVLLARVGISILLAAAPNNSTFGPVGLPRIHDIRVDWTILAFALGVSILCGVVFGVMPALYAGKTNLDHELREGSAGAGTGVGRTRLRQILVAGEFALSLVLLTGAGLMIATCARLLRTNPGFDPHHVVTLEFWLNGSRLDSTAKIAGYYDEIERRAAALPGVKAAGVVAAGLPLERGGNDAVRIAGPNQNKMYSANYREASPGYFAAMGIPVVEGRGIMDSDSGDAAPVVVVNQAFARRYFANQSAIGGHVFIENQPYEIVGVAADAKSKLTNAAPPGVFVPAAQASYGVSSLFEGWFPRRIVVRTTGDSLAVARELKQAVTAVDSSVATGEIVSMDQMMSRSVGLQEFMMVLLSVFGAVALVLASVGIYGLISFAVSQRTREIGIRMALGARQGEVLAMILGQGMKLLLVGALVGTVAAAMLTRFLQGLIYGVTVRDPIVFALGIAMLAAVSLAACLLPARRAMRVDPMVALRHE